LESGDEAYLAPCAGAERGSAASGAMAGALGEAVLRLETAIAAAACGGSCTNHPKVSLDKALSLRSCGSAHLAGSRHRDSGSRKRHRLAECNRLRLRRIHGDGSGSGCRCGWRSRDRLCSTTGREARRALCSRPRCADTASRLRGVELRASRRSATRCASSRRLQARRVQPLLFAASM
jgi:hypothetical protein